MTSLVFASIECGRIPVCSLLLVPDPVPALASGNCVAGGSTVSSGTGPGAAAA